MKTRRQPTAEEKQKAAERRERFKEISRQVAAMSEDERTALVMKVGAIVTCEGRALSTHNSCGLITQLPTVSMVGGFWQWKDKGRRVRKGERGLMIWIPKNVGETSAPAAVDLEAGEGDASEGKRKGGRFIMGTVFDVSQTEPDDGDSNAPAGWDSTATPAQEGEPCLTTD